MQSARVEKSNRLQLLIDATRSCYYHFIACQSEMNRMAARALNLTSREIGVQALSPVLDLIQVLISTILYTTLSLVVDPCQRWLI